MALSPPQSHCSAGHLPSTFDRDKYNGTFNQRGVCFFLWFGMRCNAVNVNGIALDVLGYV